MISSDIFLRPGDQLSILSRDHQQVGRDRGASYSLSRHGHKLVVRATRVTENSCPDWEIRGIIRRENRRGGWFSWAFDSGESWVAPRLGHRARCRDRPYVFPRLPTAHLEEIRSSLSVEFSGAPGILMRGCNAPLRSTVPRGSSPINNFLISHSRHVSWLSHSRVSTCDNMFPVTCRPFSRSYFCRREEINYIAHFIV